MQKSAEPGPSLQLLEEQLAAEQDGHRKSKVRSPTQLTLQDFSQKQRGYLHVHLSSGTCRLMSGGSWFLQAKVDQVRADLEQLQQALDASTSALTDRDAFWKEELLRAQRDLQTWQAQVAVSCALHNWELLYALADYLI